MNNQIELDIGSPILSHKSPLMYPGSKAKLWSTIQNYIPKDIPMIVSPFVGGASVELNCAARGIKVLAFDNFEPLVNFWNYFIKDANTVINKVLDIFPLSYEDKKHYFNTGLKPNQENHLGQACDDLERAAVFLCLNKQSFRGWTLAQTQSKGYLEASANPKLLRSLVHGIIQI